MKAVVMAGGEGSRLRPLTINRPKPMVPIANRPVMGHIIELCKRHGLVSAASPERSFRAGACLALLPYHLPASKWGQRSKRLLAFCEEDYTPRL